MRRELIERDLLECVLGLGPNLFYNSPMEACVVVCRTQKPPQRSGNVLFIDAVREVARERAQSFLEPQHQQRILIAYNGFSDEANFAAVASNVEILANDGDLSISRYLNSDASVGVHAPPTNDLKYSYAQLESTRQIFFGQMDDVVEVLEGLVEEPNSYE